MSKGQKGLLAVGIGIALVIALSMALGWKPGCHGRSCINQFPKPHASVTR